MNLYLFIAKKIKGHGLSTVSNAIAKISVAVSIAVIVIAVAITKGFKYEIGRRVKGFSGEIMLTAPGTSYLNDTYPLDAGLSYLPAIEALPEVMSVNEVVYRPGMLKAGNELHGILFKGVDSTYSLGFFGSCLVSGRLPDFSGKRMSDEIMISERLAQRMGYELGDRADVYFIGDDVRVRRLTIVGIYDVRLEKLDEMLAVADIRQLRRLAGWEPHESSCVEISLGGGSLSDSDLRYDVADRIGEIIMNRDRNEDAAVSVTLIDDVYSGIFDWLALLDLNVLVVMILMIAVAGFNMVSGLLIILFEKISTIGLFKALGMRTSAICKIFMFRGGAIVLEGMLYGNLFAVIVLLLQKYTRIMTLNPANYFVDSVPVSFGIADLLLVNAVSLLVLFLVMTIPTVFIAKVSPEKTIKVS